MRTVLYVYYQAVWTWSDRAEETRTYASCITDEKHVHMFRSNYCVSQVDVCNVKFLELFFTVAKNTMREIYQFVKQAKNASLLAAQLRCRYGASLRKLVRFLPWVGVQHLQYAQSCRQLVVKRSDSQLNRRHCSQPTHCLALSQIQLTCTKFLIHVWDSMWFATHLVF